MPAREPTSTDRRDRAASGVLAGLAAASLLFACDGIADLERDLEPPVQTSALEYTLQETEDGRGLQVEIPFRYENPTDAPICLTNCNGAYAIALVDEAGEVAWSPALPECLSAAITIDPGETLQDTLDVFHGLDSNSFPKFEGDPEGVYRLDVVAASRPGAGPACGEQLPEDGRTSNRFALER